MAASEKPEKTAYVYMVRCAGGQLYTGWTNDPEARLKAHQSGKGAKYTRTHTALGFAYLEACADKSAALRREIALKKLTKAQKEALCAGWTAEKEEIKTRTPRPAGPGPSTPCRRRTECIKRTVYSMHIQTENA